MTHYMSSLLCFVFYKPCISMVRGSPKMKWRFKNDQWNTESTNWLPSNFSFFWHGIILLSKNWVWNSSLNVSSFFFLKKQINYVTLELFTSHHNCLSWNWNSSLLFLNLQLLFITPYVLINGLYDTYNLSSKYFLPFYVLWYIFVHDHHKKGNQD